MTILKNCPIVQVQLPHNHLFFADTIISQHIEIYRELLNHAHREDDREFMEKWSKDTRNCREKEQSDDDSQEKEPEPCQNNNSGQ